MGQGVRTGLGHGGITCVLQTQFSSFYLSEDMENCKMSGKKQGILKWMIGGNLDYLPFMRTNRGISTLYYPI